MLRLSHCFLVLAFAAVASLGSIAEASVAGAGMDSWAQIGLADSAHAPGASTPYADVHAVEVAEPTSESETEADAVDETPDPEGAEAVLLGLVPGQRSCAQHARSAIERTRLVVGSRLARGPPQLVDR